MKKSNTGTAATAGGVMMLVPVPVYMIDPGPTSVSSAERSDEPFSTSALELRVNLVEKLLRTVSVPLMIKLSCNIKSVAAPVRPITRSLSGALFPKKVLRLPNCASQITVDPVLTKELTPNKLICRRNVRVILEISKRFVKFLPVTVVFWTEERSP